MTASLWMLLLLLVLFSVARGSTVETCRGTAWAWKEEVKCPSEHPHEVYRDEVGNYASLMCCRNGNDRAEQKHISQLKLDARGCRVTECRRVTEGSRYHDICTTEFPRRVLTERPSLSAVAHWDGRNRELRDFISEFFSGRTGLTWDLKYHQEIKETCVPRVVGQGMGRDGVAAVCCPAKSDSALLSMFAAELNEFPYIAYVQYINDTLSKSCGGAIYNDRHVITAAHCVYDGSTGSAGNASSFIVRVGTNIGDLPTNEDHDERVHRVEQVFVHPRYQGGVCKQNDIAVLRLSRSITFGKNVMPIKVVGEGFNPLEFGKHAIMAGWGIASNLKSIPFLRKTNLRIRDDRRCFRDGRWNGGGHHWAYQCGDGVDRTDQFICVGGLDADDSNHTHTNPMVLSRGDSGCPVVCEDGAGAAVLCGIVSFGGDFERCLAHQNVASCPFSAASEVSHFIPFITLVAGEQNEDETYKYDPYGVPVGPTEFRHQVRIVGRKGVSCGGTLIATNLLLTAGMCIKDQDEYVVQVRDRSGNVLEYSITRKKVLEGFKSETIKYIKLWFKLKQHHSVDYQMPIRDKLYDKNLAVAEISGHVDISQDELPLVKNIGGATHSPPHGDATEVAYTRSDSSNYPVLMKRKITLLHRSDCVERLTRAHVSDLMDDVVCGVERGSGGSLCDWELGGGLLCGPKRRVLCGVQIFRTCQGAAPHLYFNVGLYRDWVQWFVGRGTRGGGGGSSSGGRGSGSFSWAERMEATWTDWIRRG